MGKVLQSPRESQLVCQSPCSSGDRGKSQTKSPFVGRRLEGSLVGWLVGTACVTIRTRQAMERAKVEARSA